MKKLILGIVMILSFCTFLGCISNNSKANDKELTLSEAEKIISNYLEALSEKNIELLKKYGTYEYTKGFNEESIELLKETLEGAKLLKCEIKENSNEKALINAEVEVICYENSSPSGDWLPGKSISTKSFELIKDNDKWKVNGWGVY